MADWEETGGINGLAWELGWAGVCLKWVPWFDVKVVMNEWCC